MDRSGLSPRFATTDEERFADTAKTDERMRSCRHAAQRIGTQLADAISMSLILIRDGYPVSVKASPGGLFASNDLQVIVTATARALQVEPKVITKINGESPQQGRALYRGCKASRSPALRQKFRDLIYGDFWSGRRDLNPRPPVPQTGALTGLRHAPTGTRRTIGMDGR